MKLNNFIRQLSLGILVACLAILTSCDHFKEELPECRLFVNFKYDYNMLSADAFHTQVDKVELYVFDKDGKFLFKQVEEGTPLSTGNFRIQLEVPFGQYKLMAWAGVHDSYDVPTLQVGTSTIDELKLKLKRDPSFVINKELEPLWYGEIIDVDFTGTTNQVETINLIKDTNKIRFIFQGQTSNWTIDVNDYDYEIVTANGYLDYDNSLLADNALSFQPYFSEQRNPSAALVEFNTMRLLEHQNARLIVTKRSTGGEAFNIQLIDFLLMTEMEGHSWGAQEYLDRQDEYAIVFFFSDHATPPVNPDAWLAVQININGWTYYLQNEG